MYHSCISFCSRAQAQAWILTCIIVLFAGSGVCLPSIAQSSNAALYREAGLPFIQNFSPKTYGGHQQNWSMLQDDRGVIYIGNIPGLLEYDGAKWRTIRISNDSVARSMAMDSTGTIYVGAHAELGYLAPDSLGMMHYHSLLEHVPEEERTFTNVWKVHTTPDGVYFRTSTHLFRWAQGQMTVWKPPTEYQRSFWIDGVLYIRAWDVGLFHMVNDSLVMVPRGEQFADQRVDLMLPFSDDRILIGTRTDGLLVSTPEGYIPFETEADTYLKENQLYDGLVLPDQTIAFATLRGGLVHIDQEGRFLRSITKEDGLPDNTIWSLGLDKENGLWLMLNKGLSRVELPSPITQLTDAHGLEGSVESLSIHEGKLYAATSLGVYRQSQAERRGRTPFFTPVEGIATQAWSLHSTGSELLIATSAGVFVINNGVVSQLSEELSFFVYPSALDPSRVYVGLGHGLALLQKIEERWTYSGRFHGLTEEIRTIVEDQAGNVWLGSQFHGLVKINTNGLLPGVSDTTLTFVRYDESHDFPEGEVKVVGAGEDVYFDTQRGLLRYNEQAEKFEPATTWSSAFANTTLTVNRVVDDGGRLWIVRTGNGLREFSLLTPRTDGSFDMMPLPLTRVKDMGPFWSIYPDPRQENVLWLGGDEGIIRADISIKKQEQSSFSALIRRVLINQDSLIYGGAKIARLNEANAIGVEPQLEKNGAIRFEYSSTTFDDPSATEYQYELVGFDEGWSAWTSETVKEYTNLFAGSYQFRVRAKNLYGHISEVDTYSFTVSRPWYFRWWAFALYAIPFFFSMYVVDSYQRRRLIKRERLRAEVEQAQLKTSAAQLHARTLQAENELLNAELRFLAVVESANDAIISANQDGDIIFWNMEAEKIFGYSREEILGKPLTRLMPARHIRSHERGLNRHVATGHKRAIGKVIKLEGKRKDGSEFPLELSLSSWKTEHGIFFSAILRDITEQKEAEHELQRVQSQLAHSNKMASLGKLTAGIAHEIKNPLNFVNNFAQLTVDLVEEVDELIQDNKSKSLQEIDQELSGTLSEIKRNALAINRHGHRADSIVRSMMDHAGGGSGPHQPTDLKDLIETAIQLAYQGWLNDNADSLVAFESTYDESIGIIKLAPQEISRVIVNILENAFDAMYTSRSGQVGTASPLVQISTKQIGDFVEVRIRDNGPGITKEIQEHIFDPFYTTKPTGKGTGLGLSLSYDIVTQGHGGQLTVENNTPRGATFIIRLPV
ncbi:MAG: PAS domain S-box protein [Rhodothermaceae bacterium]|nr:PAS domain S-box protein [Rhodothermaceae bacterium]